MAFSNVTFSGCTAGVEVQWTPPEHCQRCGKGEPTEQWFGNSGFLGVSHGMFELWCKRCVARVQLRHALGRLKAIPGLLVKAVR